MADKLVLVRSEGLFAARRADALIGTVARALDADPDFAVQLRDEVQKLGPHEALRRMPGSVRKLLTACRKPGGFATVPVADWFVPLLLGYGEAYPGMDAKVREDFLRLCLSVLSGVTPEMAKGFTYRVTDPLLAGDIVANRPEFWPGVQREVKFLVKVRTTYHLFLAPPGFLDSPWMFHALMLREDFPSAEVMRYLIGEYPDAFARSFDFAATTMFATATRNARERRDKFNASLTTTLLSTYDRSFHARIRDRMEERRWTLIH